MNRIAYNLYLAAAATVLFIAPKQFLHKDLFYAFNNPLNTLMSFLVDSPLGLRILSLFHVLLLFSSLFKLQTISNFGVIIYGIFLILSLANLFTDGYGEEQSLRLELFGYQCGIFSFVFYNGFNLIKEKVPKQKVVEPAEVKQQEVKQQEPKKQKKAKKE